MMLITAQSFTTTQRLHSYKFTLVDKVVNSSAWADFFYFLDEV